LMIPVRCEGSCEIWLSNLLHSIRNTLQKLLESMHHSIVMINDDNFMEILINNPTQLGILCLQSLWTKDISEMLGSSNKISLVNIYSSMVYDKYDCGSVRKYFLKVYHTLLNHTKMVRKTNLQQAKCENLTTQCLILKEILDQLVSSFLR
ncbi:unnamed protein product, partial [Trichobilharzia szidati]